MLCKCMMNPEKTETSNQSIQDEEMVTDNDYKYSDSNETD